MYLFLCGLTSQGFTGVVPDGLMVVMMMYDDDDDVFQVLNEARTYAKDYRSRTGTVIPAKVGCC